MDEEHIYTLTIEQVTSLLNESNNEFSVCRGLLQHHLNTEEENDVCALLAELFWANFNMAKILQETLDESKESDGGYVVIGEKPLTILQTLIFSKELASRELNKFSISTKLN